MMDSAIAKRYAQALFALAQERQELKKVEGELLALRDALEANADLRSVLYHQLIPSNEKKQLISKLFNNLSQTTVNFLFVLLDKRRDTYLEDIIELYHEMCKDLEKIITADVKTAAPLSSENREALAAKLSEMTGKKVELKEEVDEKLIGGIIVTIGDRIYDYSVMSRLNGLRSALKKVQI